MPLVAELNGIAVVIHFREHPPPHFHARYGDDEAQIGIDPVEVREGHLPRRQRRMVIEWARLHQADLAAAWEQAAARRPVGRIP